MQILGKLLRHDIVSFNDGTTHPIPVVEINSAGKMICRSYTGDTIADEDSEQEINRYFESENEKGILKEIAEQKMPDLNAASIEAAMSIVAGTARSMGVVVED